MTLGTSHTLSWSLMALKISFVSACEITDLDENSQNVTEFGAGASDDPLSRCSDSPALVLLLLESFVPK